MLIEAAKEMPGYEETNYFLEVVWDSISRLPESSGRVVVLGTSIPEALFPALGVTPVWLLGGSMGSTELGDDALPRDTDPVARSAYGYLHHMERSGGKNLIVIPLINDNYRKLAYLLKRGGSEVHPVLIPPDKSEASQREWVRQMELLVRRLSAYSGIRFSKSRLEQAAEWTAAAGKQLQRFDGLADCRPKTITGIFRMLIRFSYYCADNLGEWTDRLAALNNRIAASPEEFVPQNQILLLGSPIYFPNYKIPRLIGQAGLHIAKDFTFPDPIQFSTSNKRFDDLCREFFRQDFSAAYVRNDSLFTAVSKYLDTHSVNGVIYHVLKGQIEYDFELERFETLFTRHDLPMVRLETDYNAQDIEPLRLRVEAFAEIIRHRSVKNTKKEGIAG